MQNSPARILGLDGALQQLRPVVDDLFNTGNLANCDTATEALVETLLTRGTEGDLD